MTGKRLRASGKRKPRALESPLREGIEKDACLASVHLLAAVATRYQVPEETVEEFCKMEGIPITAEADSGRKWLCNYKPSVYHQANVEKSSLQVNLCEEVPAAPLRSCSSA